MFKYDYDYVSYEVVKVEELTCKKCGYKWKPKTKEPKECPQCKSRYWKGERPF